MAARASRGAGGTGHTEPAAARRADSQAAGRARVGCVRRDLRHRRREDPAVHRGQRHWVLHHRRRLHRDQRTRRLRHPRRRRSGEEEALQGAARRARARLRQADRADERHPPIAKTLAIHTGPAPAGNVAPTAFGSLSIGSLTCTRGQLAGQRFALTATGIIVGRQPGVAHVLVNDHRASGKHVWIGLEHGRLVAIDQGTTNGTYINDVGRGRITRAELRDGDVIIVSEPDCLSLQIRVG